MRKHNWYLSFGTAITAVMLIFTVIGFFWTPYDPNNMSVTDRYSSPSLRHPFGCDQMGRDILSRTMEGTGTTLTIAVAVLAIGFVFGLLIGALCGYYGGIADALIMRICDTIASFPSVLLALVVIAVVGPGKFNVIIVLGILFIPSFARLVRGEFMKYRDQDFVRSARLMGVSNRRIIFLHIFPNIWPVILSGLTIGFNNAVLAEASMSYLGVGVTPPDASLGLMLSEAQSYLFIMPWYSIFPALAIILLILGIGLLGEGIREWMGETV